MIYHKIGRVFLYEKQEIKKKKVDKISALQTFRKMVNSLKNYVKYDIILISVLKGENIWKKDQLFL